jgi:hypothetical protein
VERGVDVKPHIQKKDGVWWCGPKQSKNLLFHCIMHKTPYLAYTRWTEKESARDIMRGFEKGA